MYYYQINAIWFCLVDNSAVNKAALTGLRFDSEKMTRPVRKLETVFCNMKYAKIDRIGVKSP